MICLICEHWAAKKKVADETAVLQAEQLELWLFVVARFSHTQAQVCLNMNYKFLSNTVLIFQLQNTIMVQSSTKKATLNLDSLFTSLPLTLRETMCFIIYFRQRLVRPVWNKNISYTRKVRNTQNIRKMLCTPSLEYKNLSWACKTDRQFVNRFTVWHHKAQRVTFNSDRINRFVYSLKSCRIFSCIILNASAWVNSVLP